MKSLLEPEAFEEVIGRLDRLTADSLPEWGKMNPGQAMRHCQFPLKIALKDGEIPKPNPLMKLVFMGFKKSLYSDKPWKPNMPTTKKFRVAEERDFEYERDLLVKLIRDFHAKRDETEWKDHPAFGKLTKEQWGKMQYKHLDHHLRQFGV